MDVFETFKNGLQSFLTDNGQIDLSTKEKDQFVVDTFKCPICNETMQQSRVCGACLSHPPAFDRTQTCYILNDALKERIHQFKYGGHLYLSRTFAELMLERFEFDGIDALIPIPLYSHRLLDRGFNQSLEIAKVLSEKTSIPVLKNCLVRRKSTPHQTRLNRTQRLTNLKNAFAIEGYLGETIRTVALVDDVITTGATMEEASKVLKETFPDLKVCVWAIAKSKA